MTSHLSHAVNQNSIDSYYTEKPKLGKRHQAIMDCFKQHGAMTARECKVRLNLSDMNHVRPRISELLNAPYELLTITGKKSDHLTGKTVDVFAINTEETPKNDDLFCAGCTKQFTYNFSCPKCTARYIASLEGAGKNSVIANREWMRFKKEKGSEFMNEVSEAMNEY